MKKFVFAIITLVLLLTTTLISQYRFSGDNNLTDFSGDNTGIIYVNYIKHYKDIKELVTDADLIAIGTIDRTIEVIPDEATRGKLYNTRSLFLIETVLKGKASEKIVLEQGGAIGWAEEVDNPVFRPGERVLLFLRKTDFWIYYLLGPWGRYMIIDDRVYSMNHILQHSGYYHAPKDLDFKGIGLDTLIQHVTNEVNTTQ